MDLSAIVTPTMAVLPPVLSAAARDTGESNTALIMSMMKYIFLANFLGLPGYTVPVGAETHPETKAVLPVGLHFLGRAWSEDVLLRLGNALDDVYGGVNKANPDASSSSAFFVEGLLTAADA
jgi:Asp-tRNA(Asn)/Glu-tRNA(Gln) amidotransferase A subunit family amidase